MTTVRLAVLAAMFCLLGPAGVPQALAGCALPPPVRFAPASQARLPPEPTIYLFLLRHPSYGQGKANDLRIVDEQEASVDFEREALPGTRDLQVLRLHVKAKSGTIVVRVGTGEGTKHIQSTATYQIDPKWLVPAKSGDTRIVDATYTYSDGCPASNGFVLTIRPFAPAYRVRIERQDWVVPGRDGPDENGASVGKIYTGQVGCVDSAVPTDKPLALEVTPLFSNGQQGETFMPGCRPSRRGSGLSRSCVAPVWSEFSGSVKSALDDR